MSTTFSKFLVTSLGATLLNGIAYYYLFPTKVLKDQAFYVNAYFIVLTLALLLAYGIRWSLLQHNRWVLEVLQGFLGLANLLLLLFLSMLGVVLVIGNYHYLPLMAYLINAWWLSLQTTKENVLRHQAQEQRTQGEVLDND